MHITIMIFFSPGEFFFYLLCHWLFKNVRLMIKSEKKMQIYVHSAFSLQSEETATYHSAS